MDTLEHSNDKIVVFDWDDTLFPMTELQNRSPVTIDEIESLTCAVYQLLLKYIDVFGSQNVIIVTNGKEGWVLKSLAILNDITFHNIPSIAALCTLISAQQFTVLSARSLFSHQYPKQTFLWKKMVFIQLLRDRFIAKSVNQNNTNRPFTLISVGDSIDEYESSMLAAQCINQKHKTNILIHRVKLKSHPNLKYMINEIKLLQDFAAVFHSVQFAINIDYHKEMLLYKESKLLA